MSKYLMLAAAAAAVAAAVSTSSNKVVPLQCQDRPRRFGNATGNTTVDPFEFEGKVFAEDDLPVELKNEKGFVDKKVGAYRATFETTVHGEDGKVTTTQWSPYRRFSQWKSIFEEFTLAVKDMPRGMPIQAAYNAIVADRKVGGLFNRKKRYSPKTVENRQKLFEQWVQKFHANFPLLFQNFQQRALLREEKRESQSSDDVNDLIVFQ